MDNFKKEFAIPEKPDEFTDEKLSEWFNRYYRKNHHLIFPADYNMTARQFVLFVQSKR